MVIEFSLAIAPKSKSPAVGSDALSVKFRAAMEQGERGVFDAGGGIVQNWTQAGSGGGVRHF